MIVIVNSRATSIVLMMRTMTYRLKGIPDLIPILLNVLGRLILLVA